MISLPSPPWLDKSDKKAWKALNSTHLRVAEALQEQGIEVALSELANIRISQINGCAYCLDVHSRKAVKNGLPQQKIDVLSAWREAGIFTATETMVLELAEVVTRLGDPARIRDVQSRSVAMLGEETTAALEWSALLMNSYNRISILSGHPLGNRPAGVS